MGTTLDSVDIAGNRKGQPNHPKEFKRQVAMVACEPGISVAKLTMAHQLKGGRRVKSGNRTRSVP